MFINEFREPYAAVRDRLMSVFTEFGHPAGSNFAFDIDVSRAWVDSQVSDIGYPNGVVFLGAKELRTNSFVSSDDFASVLFVVFHELRHIEQMASYQNVSNVDVSAMAMSRMVADANGDFYFRGHSFFRHEVDADYNGYRTLRRYVNGFFDDNSRDVDAFLVRLYNDYKLCPEIKLGTGISANTIDDIDLSFVLAKDLCENVRKQYSFNGTSYVYDDLDRTDRVKELEALKKSSDLFARTIAGPGSGFRWSKVRDAYLDSTSAEEVDKMVASVTLYLRPYYLDKFPVLKNLDLSPEAVFGFRFHESRRAVLQRLADIARFSGGSRIAGRGRDMCDIDAAMLNMSSESEFESEFDC